MPLNTSAFDNKKNENGLNTSAFQSSNSQPSSGGLNTSSFSGSLAVRNNNPGNLRFIGQKGAKEGEKGFARFNSPEEGFNALKEDIKAKQTGTTSTSLGPDSSLREFASVYAPKEDNNDPEQYASNLSQMLKTDPNARIGDLDNTQLAAAITRAESPDFDLSKIGTSTADPNEPTTQEIFETIGDENIDEVLGDAQPEFSSAVMNLNNIFGQREGPKPPQGPDTPEPDVELGEQMSETSLSTPQTTDNSNLFSRAAMDSLRVGLGTLGQFGTQIAKTGATGIRAATEGDKNQELFGVDTTAIDNELSQSSPEIFNTIDRKIDETREGLNKWSQGAIDYLDDEQRGFADLIKDQEPGLSSVREVAGVVSSGALSIGAALGISAVTKNPSAAASFLTAIESSDMYNDARSSGKSPDEAARITGKSALGTYLLERLGLESFFTNNASSRIMRGIQSGLGETTTEVAQTFQQNLARRDFDEDQPIFQGAGEAVLGAFPASAALGAVIPGRQAFSNDNLVTAIEQNSGLNRQDAEESAGQIRQMLSDYQEAFFRSTRGPDSIGLSIEEISDGDSSTPEGQQQIESETNDIVSQAYDSTINDGGVTIDPVTGEQPSEGFAVSPYPSREVQVSQNEFTRERMEQYIEDNKDLLDNEHNYVGNWVAEDGTVYMDVSTVLRDEIDAVALADMSQQLAAFNLGTFSEVNTLQGVQQYGQETIISRQQELGRELGGLQEAGIGQDGRGGIVSRINERIRQLDSEGLSNTESRESLQELKRQSQALSQAVSTHPAKPLAKYDSGTGSLPTSNSSNFVQNAESIVDEAGFDSVEQARESYQQYAELRDQRNTIQEATQSPRFSANQILNRIRNSEKRGASQARREERNSLLDDFRAQQQLNEDLIGSLRSYARSHLSSEGNLKSAMTMINNIADKRTPTGKKRAWGRSMSRIENMADQELKKDLRNQIKKKAKSIIGSGSVDVGYQERVDTMLKQIDLTGRTDKTVQKLNSIREYVEQQQKEGNDVDGMSSATLSMLERAYKTPFEEVTVNDLENALEKIDLYQQLGRQSVRNREINWERDKNKIISQLQEGSTPMNTRQLNQDKSVLDNGGLTLTEKVQNKIRGTLNKFNEIDKAILPTDVLFDMIDGSTGNFNGTNYRTFKKTLDADWREYQDVREDVMSDFRDKAEELGMEERGQESWERIGFVAAREQDGGRDKLKNLEYTDEEIDSVELNDSEREMLDYMRDKMDEQFPFVQDLMQEVFNERIERVDNYFSFMTDWDAMDQTSKEGSLEDTAMPMTGPFRTKKPEMGFTQSRSGAGDQKIKLNAAEIFQKHMDDVAYMRAMGKDLKLLFEVANDSRYEEAAGSLGQSLVLDWLDVVARKGQSGDTSAAVDTLRKNVGSGILGLKLSTVFIQPSAVFDGAGMIGGQYAAKGMKRTTFDKRWRNLVLEFPELRTRVGGEVGVEELSQERMWEKIQEKGYVPMQKVDQWAAMSIAVGAYQRKMDELGETVDFNNINEEAMDYAQLAVRQTQSTSNYKDTPLALSRGRGVTGNKSLNRAMFQFQTFLLSQWSRIRYNAIQVGIKNKDPKQAARILGWTAASTVAASGLRIAQRHLMDAIFGTEEDEEEKEMDNELLSGMLYEMTGKIPFLGNVFSMIQYDGAPFPVIDAFENTAGGIRSAVTGKNLDTRLRGLSRMAGAIGTLGGVPGSLQLESIVTPQLTEERFRQSDGIAPPPPAAAPPAAAPPAPAPPPPGA